MGSSMVHSYCEIGRMIVEEEQQRREPDLIWQKPSAKLQKPDKKMLQQKLQQWIEEFENENV